MRLTEWFSQDRITDSKRMQQTGNGKATEQVNREIRALAPGQTLRGEVVSRDGNTAQIKLLQDVLIDARVDEDIRLALGQTITFQVKTNGQVLSLSPLFTNMATEETVWKALDMAAVPVNDKTIAMTKQLMDAGLPIDKGTLQQLWHESTTFPEAEIADLVNLHRLGLPVTEDNIAQMSSYRNLTHQLTAGMEETATALTATLQKMAESGKVEQAAKIYSEVLKLFSDSPEAESAVNAAEGNSSVKLPETETVQGAYGRENIQQPTGQPKNPVTMEAATEPSADKQIIAKQMPQGIDGTDDIIHSEESIQIQNLQKQIEQGLTAKDVSLLRTVLQNPKTAELTSKLLLEQWSIRPEEVDSPEKVEQLYQKMSRQLKGLTAALEENGQSGSGAYQTAVNLSQNIDFLQQINQTYAYIQLPLHLKQGEHKTGELFVYTNKKNLARKDGQVSALLHLDMEHLGPLDVYVALQDNRVSTKFYVQNDTILDYLEANMDVLTERLKQRGYDCKCETTLRTQMQQTAQAMAPLLKTEGSVPVAQYAFDVRT